MNKSGINNNGGSFGIPEDLLEAVNESKAKAKGKKYEKKAQAYTDSESIPEETEEETSKAEEVIEEDPDVTLQKQIKEIKASLKVDIDEDDLWSIFMGNQLEKEDIVIIPGKLVASMRTLSLDETQAIDTKMAEALEMKFLEAGFMNLKTKHLLAAGLTGLGKPGKARQLGKTHEERFEALGKMSTVLVERLAHKWNQFTWLVNEIVNQEMDSGNS
jgi:hypothetical protein